MKSLPALIVICLLTTVVSAQWPAYVRKDAPKAPDGHVDMDAPAPRLANGKPDFSGVWESRVGPTGRFGAPALPSLTPDAPPVATFANVEQNIKGGLPLTPWAAEIKKQRMATNSVNNPDANCLPLGIHPLHTHPDPRQIVQTPTLLVIAWESNYGLRFIHTDGRKLPPLGEPQPWWYGYSAGHWEGDTLVVETNNVRGAEMGPFDGWLDVDGSPHSDQVKFTERFRRPTFGKLEIDLTVEDPKAYTKPFTVRINQELMADDELLEFICNENQQFRRRVKVD